MPVGGRLSNQMKQASEAHRAIARRLAEEMASRTPDPARIDALTRDRSRTRMALHKMRSGLGPSLPVSPAEVA